MTAIFASWKQLNLCQFMPVVTYLNIYREVKIFVPKNCRSFDGNQANEIAHALTKCPVKSPKRKTVTVVPHSLQLKKLSFQKTC